MVEGGVGLEKLFEHLIEIFGGLLKLTKFCFESFWKIFHDCVPIGLSLENFDDLANYFLQHRYFILDFCVFVDILGNGEGVYSDCVHLLTIFLVAQTDFPEETPPNKITSAIGDVIAPDSLFGGFSPA